jgi:hypothetical protein
MRSDSPEASLDSFLMRGTIGVRYMRSRKGAPMRRLSGPEILKTDSQKDIARKLVRYAFRAAAKRCHSDQGGSDELFCRLKEAETMLLECVGRK